MGNLKKIEEFEKLCVSINKEDVGTYTFPTDAVVDHILNLIDSNYSKFDLIEKIANSIKLSGADEQELITMSNLISGVSLELTNGKDNPFL
jgi:hypothetical protein